MTTTQRQRPSRPAPNAPDPASRGLILVAVAVVLGIILLVKGGGVGFDRDDSELEIGSGEEGTEQPAAPTTTEAPPETSVPPAELQIVALNAAGINGYAGQSQQFLSVAGYSSVTPITAAASVDRSVVHFAEGFIVDALNVAQLLELEMGDVQPMPADPTTLARDAAEFPAGANVAILLGPDVAPTVQGAANAAEGGGAEGGGAEGGGAEGGGAEGGGATAGGGEGDTADAGT
jgi:uncharacterized membrane protein YgcG